MTVRAEEWEIPIIYSFIRLSGESMRQRQELPSFVIIIIFIDEEICQETTQ